MTEVTLPTPNLICKYFEKAKRKLLHPGSFANPYPVGIPGRAQDCWIMKGYEPVRLASLEERKTLYIHNTWGLSVIAILAEAYFVKKKPSVRRLPWDELMELKRQLIGQ